MNAEQKFYKTLDTFLEIQSDNGKLIKQENELISIEPKCEGGCVFSEFTFAILRGGEIAIFWESKPEFWKDCDAEQHTDLFTTELETEVKNMIAKYLDKEAKDGISDDMADLITSQKIEARKFRDNLK